MSNPMLGADYPCGQVAMIDKAAKLEGGAAAAGLQERNYIPLILFNK